jgi:hypothetical protein
MRMRPDQCTNFHQRIGKGKKEPTLDEKVRSSMACKHTAMVEVAGSNSLILILLFNININIKKFYITTYWPQQRTTQSEMTLKMSTYVLKLKVCQQFFIKFQDTLSQSLSLKSYDPNVWPN